MLCGTDTWGSFVCARDRFEGGAIASNAPTISVLPTSWMFMLAFKNHGRGGAYRRFSGSDIRVCL
jgi:hypothetical protein